MITSATSVSKPAVLLGVVAWRAMAEPISISVAVLKVLIPVGAAIYKGYKERDVEKALALVQELLSGGKEIAGLLPQGTTPRLAARYALLLSNAFSAAWRAHFGPRFGLDNPKQVEQQQQAAVAWALNGAKAVEGATLGSLVRDPEEGALYKALLEAFSDKALTDAALVKTWSNPLILAHSAEDRSAFERLFRSEWSILPWRTLQQKKIPVLEIAAFDRPRSEAWLSEWNRRSGKPAVSLEGWRQDELLGTPILLFMLAFTGATPSVVMAEEVVPNDPVDAEELRGWELYASNLQEANLRGANLQRANLQRANLHQASYDDDTEWPEGFDFSSIRPDLAVTDEDD